MREMLQFLLEDAGYDAVAVPDGREALEVVARRALRPDLVIADYNLPKELNGLQLGARLQEMLPQRVPVIILTGDISTETISEIERHDLTYAQQAGKAARTEPPDPAPPLRT